MIGPRGGEPNPNGRGRRPAGERPDGTPSILDEVRADSRIGALRTLLEALKELAADSRPESAHSVGELVRAADELLHRFESAEPYAVEDGAHHALRQLLEIEQRRYRELFESAPEACIVTDPRGVIRETNRAASELLGMEAPELKGRELDGLGPEGRREEVRDRLSRIRESGEPERFQWSVATRHRSVVPVHVAADAVGPSGSRPTGSIRWIMRDAEEEERAAQNRGLVERLATERAEAERTAMHRGLLSRVAGLVTASPLEYRSSLTSVARLLVEECADACIVWLRRGGDVRTTASAVTGRDTQRSAAKFLLDFGLSGSATSEIVGEMIESGAAWLLCEDVLGERAGERRIRRREEATGVCRGVVVPLDASSGPFGALGMFDLGVGPGFGEQDVDFARELASTTALSVENARLFAEAKEALRKRDRVQRVVSHDLRNEVTKLELLLDSFRAKAPEADRELRETLDRAETSAGRIVSLVDDLDPAVADASGRPLSLDPVDVGELLRRVRDSHELSAKRREVGLSLRIADDLRDVPGDEDRLMQVLDNLVQNAVEFTPPGGRVQLRAAPAEDGVRVSVLDTGPGVAEEDRHRMFDRFWRGERASEVEGSGLGLSIARSLVEAHGGRIRAENRDEGGLEITFFLPLSPSGEEDDPGPAPVGRIGG